MVCVWLCAVVVVLHVGFFGCVDGHDVPVVNVTEQEHRASRLVPRGGVTCCGVSARRCATVAGTGKVQYEVPGYSTVACCIGPRTVEFRRSRWVPVPGTGMYRYWYVGSFRCTGYRYLYCTR